jgi:hypothetical protein
MNTAPLIKHFQDHRCLISIVETSEKIQDLNSNLQSIQTYFNHHRETFTEKEKKQQQEKSKQIQDEIDYYKTSIFYAQQTYEDNEQSPYGYSLRVRTPSVSDSDSDEEKARPTTNPLENKINRIEEVVYQLIGGLFNHETQFSVIRGHHACLNGTVNPGGFRDQSIYPTTRQGDANEKEIRLLKEQVAKLEGTVSVLFELLSKK